MLESIWNFVGENFDGTLPRMTAVYIKENISSTSFAYPTGENRIGYCFDFSDQTAYDIPEKFRFDFASYAFPGQLDNLYKPRALFTRQTYFPSLFDRQADYTNLPFVVDEYFGNALEDSFTWRLKCRSKAVHDRATTVYSVIFSAEPFSVEPIDHALCLKFDDLTYYIASDDIASFGLYEHDMAMHNTLGRQENPDVCKKGHYLALRHDIAMPAHGEQIISFGLSKKSVALAKKAAEITDVAKRVEENWAAFFKALPAVDFHTEREKKTYYKSWVTIRNNYYAHKSWGHSITECLPVYKGIWQWAISSVEWHDDQNPEYPSVWIKKAMDMLMASQRADGYVTHAIYVDETRPGERWESLSTIQTPHLAWTALRYYYATKDIDSLRRWYEPLKKYYEYISSSRDEALEKLHLWATLSSFETGLDTTSVFEKVTYGENGEKEPYCYPAIFAAERYRYELAMANISSLLGYDGTSWLSEAKLTKSACENVLWDEEKKWFGVRHADGVLDTRVGIDGLFVYAYDMVDQNRAEQMKTNFKKLLGEYGVRTVAQDEPGFYGDVYWRGPCWPKSASLGMHAAQKYYPDLMKECLDGIINMALKYANIWECMDVSNGKLAHSDRGIYCTPGMTSNVGAGDIIGSVLASHGFDMYATEMPIPLVEMKNFRAGGMRLTVTKTDNGFVVHATACPEKQGSIPFSTPDGIQYIAITTAKDVFISC